MSSLNAYLPAAEQQMVREILEAAPGESLSGLVQQAVRRRFAELVGCDHEVCACVTCGTIFGHPATSATTTAAARPTRTAATSTAVVKIEDERRIGV